MRIAKLLLVFLILGCAWSGLTHAQEFQCPNTKKNEPIILTDGLWGTANSTLKPVLECMEDGDALLINTTSPLEFAEIAEVNKSVVVSAWDAAVEDFLKQPVAGRDYSRFPRAKNRVKIRCPRAPDDGAFTFRTNGAVLANLVFENCLLIQDLPPGEKVRGGVVAVGSCDSSGIPVRIIHTLFRDNFSKVSTGGVFVRNCTIQILNSRFLRTVGTALGGALLSDNGIIVAENVDFSFNEAIRDPTGSIPGAFGGAINLLENSSMTAINCRFEGNKAPSSGGAARVLASSLRVLNSFAMNNSAEQFGGFGAVYNSTIVMTNVTGKDNRASAAGGFLHATANSSVVLADSRISNNTVETGNGGAIDLEGIVLGDVVGFYDEIGIAPRLDDLIFTDLEAVNVEFANNSATNGGGIYAQNNVRITLIGSSIVGNTAFQGGGISAVGSSPPVGFDAGNDEDVAKLLAAVSNNEPFAFEPSEEAASLAAPLKVDLLLENVQMVENSGGLWGGGVSMVKHCLMTARNSVFEQNDGGIFGGGAIYGVSSTITAEGVEFTANKGRGGGAVHVDTDDDALIRWRPSFVARNTSFGSNNAKQGGALYVGLDVRTTLEDVGFTNNSANASGGAIYFLAAKTLEARGTLFENNTALETGGAISILYTQSIGDTPVLDAEGSIFRGNSVSRDGGALYVDRVDGTNVQRSQIKTQTMPVSDRLLLRLENTVLEGNRADDNGGGIFSSAFKFVLNACLAQGNIARNGGAVYSAGASVISATRTTFANNSAEEFGGGVYSNGQLLNCTKCVYERNSALNGGAIAAFGVGGVASLRDTQLRSNRALGGGGGGVYAATGTSVFVECNASELIQLSELDTLKRCPGKDWSGNSARGENDGETVGYGPAIASNPVSMTVTPLSILAHRSGDLLEPIRVELVDRFGTVVSRKGEMVETLVAESNVSDLTGQTLLDASSGVGVFRSLVLAVDVGLEPVSVPLMIKWQRLEDEQEVVVNVTVLGCAPGELIDGKRCRPCAMDTFSFNPQNSSCDLCQAGARCPGGGVIVPLDTFWHSSPMSVQIHSCINKDACQFPNRTELLASRMLKAQNLSVPILGVADYPLCSDGYKGIVCGECVDGYGYTGVGNCSKCAGKGANGVFIALVLLLMLCVITYNVRTNLKSMDGALGNEAPATSKSRAAEIAKVFLNYLQVVYLARFIDLEWPKSIVAIFQGQGTIGSLGLGDVVSLDCSMPSGSVPKSIRRSVIMILLPLIFAVFALFFWAIVALVTKMRRTFNLTALHLGLKITMFVIIFLLYPTVNRSILSLFDCIELDEQDAATAYFEAANAVGKYWVQDTGIKCFKGQHLALVLSLGALGLALFSFGVPSLSWLVLSFKDRMDGNTLMTYGFLYRSYKPQFYFWESLILGRKLLVVMVTVFARNLELALQAYLMLGVLLLAMLLQLLVEPFQEHVLNRMEVCSLSISFLTFFLGLFFLSDDTTAGWRVVLTVVIITANVGIMVWFVKELFVSVRWRRIATVCRSAWGSAKGYLNRSGKDSGTGKASSTGQGSDASC